MALMVVVPLTLRVLTPVTAPPKLALPVTAREFAPPATVLVKVTVLPTRVVLAPKVTAPLYACVPLVVIGALWTVVVVVVAAALDD